MLKLFPLAGCYAVQMENGKRSFAEVEGVDREKIVTEAFAACKKDFWKVRSDADMEKMKTEALDAVKTAVEHFGPNVRDEGKSTLLITAVSDKPFYRKTDRIVDYLLEQPEIDVNAFDRYGRSALFMGGANEQYKSIRKILDAGGDVNNNPDFGDTRSALHLSVSHNRDAAMQFLLAGAEVDYQDKDGKTALMEAASFDNSYMNLEMLLNFNPNTDILTNDVQPQYGHDPTFTAGWSALHWGAQYDNWGRMDQLLDAGAVVDKPTTVGGKWTPFEICLLDFKRRDRVALDNFIQQSTQLLLNMATNGLPYAKLQCGSSLITADRKNGGGANFFYRHPQLNKSIFQIARDNNPALFQKVKEELLHIKSRAGQTEDNAQELKQLLVLSTTQSLLAIAQGPAKSSQERGMAGKFADLSLESFDVEEVNFLLELGANVFARSHITNKSAIQHAFETNRELYQILLNHSNNKLIRAAGIYKNACKTSGLLRTGFISVNHTEEGSGKTALTKMISEQEYPCDDTTNTLLTYGINIYQRDNAGKNAIHYDREKHGFNMVEATHYLFSLVQGTIPDGLIDQITSFSQGIRFFCVEDDAAKARITEMASTPKEHLKISDLVWFLLTEKGNVGTANIFATDDRGKTVIDYCAESGNEELLDIIFAETLLKKYVEHGFKLNPSAIYKWFFQFQIDYPQYANKLDPIRHIFERFPRH